jgi:hypothetical protein
MQALAAFGAPLHDLTLDDLTKSDAVFQIGLPPSRVDILSGVWSGGTSMRVAARGCALSCKRLVQGPGNGPTI